jgi:hypothetical protein
MAKKRNDSELSNISPERQKELSQIPKTKNLTKDLFPSKSSAEKKEEAKRYEGILKSGTK